MIVVGHEQEEEIYNAFCMGRHRTECAYGEFVSKCGGELHEIHSGAASYALRFAMDMTIVSTETERSIFSRFVASRLAGLSPSMQYSVLYDVSDQYEQFVADHGGKLVEANYAPEIHFENESDAVMFLLKFYHE